MSRIGKKPVELPSGVQATVEGQTVTVKGPKGQLAWTLADEIEARLEDQQIVLAKRNDGARAQAMWGLSRSLVNNMVVGVTKGYEQTLELVGVGYRAAMKGQMLSMQLGFSHDVEIKPPPGISFAVPRQTEIRVSGIDKQLVGEITARIRRVRPPEPYKGKGVRYAGEKVRRKEGKKK
ncbi:MAG TPA: 50S ribosomal protein L6 [Phenylobacterium sp.]|uniref:50S ribosomal protein L6 n=1 Tax=Phenylobacterium sp. TaxID=1871053 RepID=UPI002BB298D7|nr:50S ribosomal protein L6 [Phenylobacterium sp.]HSV03507.1 50S ribosomal protein L6 [Phenylobacterium sp.]